MSEHPDERYENTVVGTMAQQQQRQWLDNTDPYSAVIILATVAFSVIGTVLVGFIGFAFGERSKSGFIEYVEVPKETPPRSKHKEIRGNVHRKSLTPRTKEAIKAFEGDVSS